jgi:hypothetical protein
MKGKTIIKIQGRLDKKWKDSFEAIEITYEGNNTLITEDIKDESHLHGILNLLRDLNLVIISINPAQINNEL